MRTWRPIASFPAGLIISEPALTEASGSFARIRSSGFSPLPSMGVVSVEHLSGSGHMQCQQGTLNYCSSADNWCYPFPFLTVAIAVWGFNGSQSSEHITVIMLIFTFFYYQALVLSAPYSKEDDWLVESIKHRPLPPGWTSQIHWGLKCKESGGSEFIPH